MQGGNYGPPPSTGGAVMIHSVEERRAALYEIVYLVLVVNLYIASVFAPLLGLVTGVFLLVGGTHPQTKRVGKIALICAAVGIVVVVVGVILWVALIGAAAAVS